MRNSIQANKKLFLIKTVLIATLILGGCRENPSQKVEDFNISSDDIEQIKQIGKDYTDGWLENDAEKVLGLYSDSAIIIPSGLNPINGKKAITGFWFPNDSSITTIHYYDLEILDISGTTNHAYTYEHGKLSFTYEKDDFRMDREAESYAITIYEKTNLNEWKITKRIWTDMNK